MACPEVDNPSERPAASQQSDSAAPGTPASDQAPETSDEADSSAPASLVDPAPKKTIMERIQDYSEKHDTDFIAYFGDIKKDWDDYIIDQCRERKLRKNVLLIISTRGGDPNAGYRISRCLQEAYHTLGRDNLFTRNGKGPAPIAEEHRGTFTVLIDGICKSAGTLICLGADKIIMSGNGEFGPIDIQLLKRDEVGERESGLTPIQALRLLELQASSHFKRYFSALRFSEDLLFSTKMAKEVATDMTIGLLAPVYAQIDPIRLAEVDRSMRIANEYGERLKNDNLHDGALEKLVAGYPSHGFAIDRAEARSIFKKVEEPCEELRKIGTFFREIADMANSGERSNFPFVSFLSSPPAEDSVNIKVKPKGA